MPITMIIRIGFIESRSVGTRAERHASRDRTSDKTYARWLLESRDNRSHRSCIPRYSALYSVDQEIKVPAIPLRVLYNL
jgi:hypothetical protein